MKRFAKYIFSLMLIFTISSQNKVSAAVTYPVQLNAQVLPPYSNCIGDYIAADRIRVTCLLLDLKKANYPIEISMKVMQGSQLKFASKTNHQEFVRPNEIHTFNLKDLFSSTNITGKYDADGYCLKEGGYEFVFQAFDGNNPKLAISEPVRFFAYLSQSEPPRLISPADGECVNYQAAAINFVWMESTIGYFNANRAYRIEVFEVPENMENYDQQAIINSNPTKFTIEGINGNLNFHSYTNTAGKLIKGRTYLWRVQVYDKNRNISDGKNVYTSANQFANGGYSKVYSFKYANCMPFDIQKDNIDESKKPILLRVDSTDASATVYWKKEKDKFPCGYVVAFNKAGDTLSNWAKIEVGADDSSYVFKNIAPGVRYITHITGIVNCDTTGSKVLSANSKDGTFTRPKPTEKDCHNSIDALTSQSSIDDLKVNDYITANDRNVKLTKIERIITEKNDTLFSGEGVVYCPLLENKLGLKVKFDSVRINTNYELMKGLVYAPTDMQNAAFLDADGLINQSYVGTGASPIQTKKYEIYNNKEAIPDGKIGVVNDQVYARNGNTFTPVGKLDKGELVCDMMENGIDYSYGVVTFLSDNEWNPPFDYGKEAFRDADVEEYYTNYSMGMNNSYKVPWIAMVTGKANSIKAKFDNKQKGIPDSAIVFVCKTKDEKVLLESSFDSRTKEYTIEIYGDEAKHSMDIYAMYIDTVECLTVGHARIMTMPRQTQELVLVPVQRDLSDVDGATIEKQLNSIYQPLGVTFNVTVDDRLGIEGDSTYNFLNDGLAVDSSGLFSIYTDEMKNLLHLYAAERTVKDSAAYIFIVKEATREGVLGDMPRSNQVGFVFSKGKFADGLTVAHELGHGLFSFEHTFENGGPEKGSTNNLMDYSNKVPKDLKVWQWNLIYSHKTYTIPFLEDDEEGMKIENKIPIVKLEAIEGASYGVDYVEKEVTDYVSVEIGQQTTFKLSILEASSVDTCYLELRDSNNFSMTNDKVLRKGEFMDVTIESKKFSDSETHKSTSIRIHKNNLKGEVLGEIIVCAYKMKPIDFLIYSISDKDSKKNITDVSHLLENANIKEKINSILRSAVAKIGKFDIVKVNYHFDLNDNGALDYNEYEENYGQEVNKLMQFAKSNNLDKNAIFYINTSIHKNFQIKEFSQTSQNIITVKNPDNKIIEKGALIYLFYDTHYKNDSLIDYSSANGDRWAKIKLNRNLTDNKNPDDLVWRKISGMNLKGANVPQIVIHKVVDKIDKTERDIVVIVHERLHNFDLYDLEKNGLGDSNIMLFNANNEGINKELRNRPLDEFVKNYSKVEIPTQKQWDLIHSENK